MIDLTKLILHTGYNAFKNNDLTTGTFTLTGSTAAGLNSRTFTFDIGPSPDMVDVVFNGPTDTVFSSDPRPSTGWFKQGFIYTITNNAGGGNPARWTVNSEINGSTLTITCQYPQGFVTAETLTSTDCSFRLVDYSVL